MAITQKQLARMFRVSQMTVSRALRGRPEVRPELRAAIQAAAARQGYSAEANHAARVMQHRAQGRSCPSNVLCLMIHQGSEDDRDSFHGRVLRGVRTAAEELNLEVILAINQLHRFPLVVARQQVDGVVRVLAHWHVLHGELECPVPWVSVLTEIAGCDVVTVDNRAGGLMIGQLLGELGHRRAAYVGPDTPMSRARLAGAQTALAAAGGVLPDHLVAFHDYAAGEEQGARELMDQLCAAAPPRTGFTALIAYNDFLAVNAIRYLRALGLRIPEDVSVTGFDGALPIGYRGRDLTTVAVPLEDLGAEAVRLLQARLREPGAPPCRRELPIALWCGDTTGAPPA